MTLEVDQNKPLVVLTDKEGKCKAWVIYSELGILSEHFKDLNLQSIQELEDYLNSLEAIIGGGSGVDNFYGVYENVSAYLDDVEETETLKASLRLPDDSLGIFAQLEEEAVS